MHDLAFIRKNSDLFQLRLRHRGLQDGIIEELLSLDNQRKQVAKEIDDCRAAANKKSDEIRALLKSGYSIEAEQEKAWVRQITERIQEFDVQKRQIEANIASIATRLPNLLHESVPFGTDSKCNLEVRRWGAPPQFDFQPRPHWEIAEELGILDLERATKLAGTRFAVYRGPGATMERALANLMLDLHTLESGYSEVLPPFIGNSQTLFGTGNLPKFDSELYQLADTNFWLIPTAEVPLTCLYRDEVIPDEFLPLKLTAWTPCFRREAGSHGRDVRGILRQHQFQKVELVKLAHPDQSYLELESLVGDAEKILQRLGLHYRVMLLCTGDTGFASAKTYDIEVWLPGQDAFREISSCSNCEAFQARRANIRFRHRLGAKPELVHTLNGSGLAIGRTWLAILENYQQRDGSVVIPEALRPYMNGLTTILPLKR